MTRAKAEIEFKRTIENRLEIVGRMTAVGVSLITLGLLLGAVITSLANGWDAMKESIIWLILFWSNIGAIAVGAIITAIAGFLFDRIYYG